jgi:hypothetical protein
MPRAIGANSKLHMAVEAAYGEPPGGNWRLMPFVSCDLGAEQPFIDADVIGLAPNRDVAPPFRDIVTVQGQAVAPVDLAFIGDWLTLLLGPPTSSGADPDYEHVFVSGASPLPSAGIELAYPDVPNFDVMAGVRADTWEIDFSPSGAATATVGLIGQGLADEPRRRLRSRRVQARFFAAAITVFSSASTSSAESVPSRSARALTSHSMATKRSRRSSASCIRRSAWRITSLALANRPEATLASMNCSCCRVRLTFGTTHAPQPSWPSWTCPPRRSR